MHTAEAEWLAEIDKAVEHMMNLVKPAQNDNTMDIMNNQNYTYSTYMPF